MNHQIRQLNAPNIPETIRLFQISFQDDHMYNEYGLTMEQTLDSFSDAISYAVNHGPSFGIYLNQQLISFLLGFDYHEGFRSHPDNMANIFGLDKTGRSLYTELNRFFEETEKHKNLYYIMSVATLQPYRQQGFASALMDMLLQSTTYDIISDVSSMISMPMYRKRGFQTVELGTDYNMVILTR